MVEFETQPQVRPDQSWHSHLVATVTLGIPLAGAQLAQMAINTTDLLLLGRLSASDLAAGVLATQVFFIVYIFGAGFTNAVMPVAAHAHGRGDATLVRRSVRMGLWVVFIYSAVMVVPLHFTEALLLLAGQKPQIAALSGDYMRIAEWALFPGLGVMALRAFFTAIGRAQIILWAMIGGTLANLVVGYAFIFGELGAPALGIRGAAVGSLGTNTIIFVLLALVAGKARAYRAYALFTRMWRADWPVFAEVLRLGFPVATTIIAEVGLFTMSSLMMGWLGTVALAAHGIVLQITAIAFMVPLGLSQAATVRVGQAHGSGDRQALARAAGAVVALGVVVSLAGAALFWLVPKWLIGLFLDENDPLSGRVLAAAVPFLAVAACFQLADCMQVLGAGLLRGLRDTRVPMMLALFSYWIVGMPMAYILAFKLDYGGVGVWLGLAGGLVTAAILATWRFQHREALGLV
ncbi:MATE family efflux transporter [Pararhizobium mangrovi]|uniref:Multidrug-efflux transporter n=1 Tax=Pararhizobium mangrovi TaxID=2590452 RepID=A0A506UAG5_9HYPH|nr:MATE family efflux transporter [Pararhizobium mangrovi]TPW30356.1 MATE family efflux transporter [Pararhizobium mangrovi]